MGKPPVENLIADAIIEDIHNRDGLRAVWMKIDPEIRDEIEVEWRATIHRELANQTGTFVWAVAQSRPMRRTSWLKHPPMPAAREDMMRVLVENTWVYLRPLVESNTESRWIWLTTGKPVSLNFEDYKANDWEVM